MKRLLDWHLKQWKTDSYRKPLLIRGARQVGKTYSVHAFSETFESFVEINFERDKIAKKIFEKNLVTERIVRDLILLSQKSIMPGKTLLFFDEIQECPAAITSLRYFFEELPALHVIAAGSLVDFAIEKVGIPVGRVSSLYVYPLSFMEFLIAVGESRLAEAILDEEKRFPLEEPIHGKLLDLIGEYLAIGGMPEAVARWVETKDPGESAKVHHELRDTYRQDMGKYAEKHQMVYLNALFDGIPRCVGKRFKYSAIHGRYKKRELAPCLDLLDRAGIVHRVQYLAWFKLIFLDVAMCQAILGADFSAWFLDPRKAFVNRGAVVEAFVGQEFLSYAHPHRMAGLCFWKSEGTGQAEVDYLWNCEGKWILPIEAKSGDGRTLKSLHRFLELHPQSPYGIRFSAQLPSTFQKIETKPLYAVAELAHESQKAAIRSLL